MSTGPAVGPIDVPFHVPAIGPEEIEAVTAVLRTGWITTGPECARFEAAFAEWVGHDVEAVAVNSCTAALHLALEAAGVGAGDIVLTSPYTFTATAEVVRYLGADVVFVDVDPVTGNITRELVEETWKGLAPSVRRRIRALVPVHFAGLPCDMSALADLAARHGWTLLDDAAHALPAHHQGLPIGALGDVTAFSFYATKTLSTGEGGMLVTKRADLAARARVMRLHGIDRDSFRRYTDPNQWGYEVIEAGFKYNMTDIAAAIGVVQLRRLEERQRVRRATADLYTAALSQHEGLMTPPDAAPGDGHAWHLYALRVSGGTQVRDEMIRALASLGVMCSVHFIPLHLHPYYRRRYSLSAHDFPGATRLFEQEISLPLFPGMTDAQVETVIEAVPRALAQAHERARAAG